MTTKSLQPSDAEAAKSRILSHMNKDHSDSLALYLAHTHRHLSPAGLSPRLLDISFTSLTIALRSRGSDTLSVPIDPPLASWMEARGRLEAMDNEARAALGRERLRVKKFIPPQSVFGWLWHGFLALYFGTFWSRRNFVPGAGVYEGAGLGHVPRFGDFCYVMQPYVFWFSVGMHVLETGWVVRGRLRRWNVDLGPAWVWWAWVLDVAFEGGPGIWRFDGEVRRLQEEEESKRKGN